MATSSAGQGDPASLCRVTEHMSPANDVAVPGQRLAIGGQANSSQVTKPGHIDVSTPNVARMYDWFLGGKDNYAADREAGAKVLTRYPGARLAARANRAFLRWAVRHLAGSRGIRQFLDVGTGLPTQQNVHEVNHSDFRGGPEASIICWQKGESRHDASPEEVPPRTSRARDTDGL